MLAPQHHEALGLHYLPYQLATSFVAVDVGLPLSDFKSQTYNDFGRRALGESKLAEQSHTYEYLPDLLRT
eukprot:g18382.t1